MLCRSSAPCPWKELDISILALQGGGVVEIARALSDAGHLSEGLETLGGTAGGAAPLWTGLKHAVSLARALESGPAGARIGAEILLISAAGAEVIDGAAPDGLARSMLEPTPISFHVIQLVRRGAELGALAAQTGGIWLPLGGPTARSLAGAMDALRSATAGRWRVEGALRSTPPPTGSGALRGEMGLRLDQESRGAPVELPFRYP